MQKIYNQISSDKAIINIYKTIEENENINKGWTYHNLDHIKNVTNIVETILNELNYSEELITKAKIASFMHDIGCLEGKEDNWYDTPNNVVGVLVDPISGKLAKNSTKNKKIVYYIKGTEPTISDSTLDDVIPTIKQE